MNEELNDKCMTKTVKYGGGSVMVWACMAASGEKGRLSQHSTAKCYPHVEKLGLEGNWVF